MLGYLGSPGLGSKVRHVGYYAVKGTDAYCNLNSYLIVLLYKIDMFIDHNSVLKRTVHTALHGLWHDNTVKFS